MSYGTGAEISKRGKLKKSYLCKINSSNGTIINLPMRFANKPMKIVLLDEQIELEDKSIYDGAIITLEEVLSKVYYPKISGTGSYIKLPKIMRWRRVRVVELDR